MVAVRPSQHLPAEKVEERERQGPALLQIPMPRLRQGDELSTLIRIDRRVYRGGASRRGLGSRSRGPICRAGNELLSAREGRGARFVVAAIRAASIQRQVAADATAGLPACPLDLRVVP